MTTQQPDATRLDRNWDELLQELRVTQTGVQLLSGFLLTVPFSSRFEDLDRVQHATFLAVFSGSVLATALLVAPVAFHRLLFRQHQRRWLVEAANLCARAGLTVLALTTSGVLFLVYDLVVPRELAASAGALTASLFVMLWVVLPLLVVRSRGVDALTEE
ncbi:DUF6328 family protein [Nocardioides cavernaquae]|uniref:Sodium:proton antiporter n=1 Tax=Nocardioides cavernaquae TaxID=2321396 RepID=A0A3A5HJE2_9ACTN|nr:DUF6328 family protein [Nocardioides cavernaquae]RJS47990.1 sodium:proton antiporter [Nocardioides cavernaquae]